MVALEDPARIRQDIDRIADIAGRVQVVPAHDVSSCAGIPVLSAEAWGVTSPEGGRADPDAVITTRALRGRRIYARDLGVDDTTAERLMGERAGAGVTALVASRVVDERLDVYLRQARRNGVEEPGLAALMILLAAHLGRPYPSAAMTAVHLSRHEEPLHPTGG